MCLPLFATAQNERTETFLKSDSVSLDKPVSLKNDSTLFYPSLPAPYFSSFGPLHEGFNGAVSLYATIGLGHNRPKGVGFGKSINLTYAKPLYKRWSYALSADVNSMKWGNYQWNQAIVGGEVNYACTDRLSFSVMGYKELVHPNTLMPYMRDYYSDPFMMNRDSYVGGAVNFKFSDSFFIQVGFGTGTYKDR